MMAMVTVFLLARIFIDGVAIVALIGWLRKALA